MLFLVTDFLHHVHPLDLPASDFDGTGLMPENIEVNKVSVNNLDQKNQEMVNERKFILHSQK